MQQYLSLDPSIVHLIMDDSSGTRTRTRELSTTTHLSMTIDACGKEIETLLKTDFHFDTVQVVPFSAGAHWISIPLKMAGRVRGADRVLLAKVVTDEGVRTHREIVTRKNARFMRHAILDLSYEESETAYDILQREEDFLEESREANIFVPAPRGVYQLTAGAVLMMEFVDGVSLQRVTLKERDIGKVFEIVKQLRVHGLVHGDIRRDNFLVTAGREVCLVDYLYLAGAVERAMSYDLMSTVCHLSLSAEASVVVNAACTFFSAAELQDALPFLNFITRRLPHQKRDQILEMVSALP